MTQGESTLDRRRRLADRHACTAGATTRSMSVDPADDCTFWYTNEYIPANGTFNWRTRIGSFKFPSCGGTASTATTAAATAYRHRLHRRRHRLRHHRRHRLHRPPTT